MILYNLLLVNGEESLDIYTAFGISVGCIPAWSFLCSKLLRRLKPERVRELEEKKEEKKERKKVVRKGERTLVLHFPGYILVFICNGLAKYTIVKPVDTIYYGIFQRIRIWKIKLKV